MKMNHSVFESIAKNLNSSALADFGKLKKGLIGTGDKFLSNKDDIKKLMKNKNSLKECKCIHCQQKLEQINNSRLYWDKLILSKNLT